MSLFNDSTKDPLVVLHNFIEFLLIFLGRNYLFIILLEVKLTPGIGEVILPSAC
jgi:hypothetical protein